MPISASDIHVSMLLSFTFSQHKNFIMLFLFFLVVLNNCIVIPVVREKIKVKLAIAIATGAPTILVKEQIDTPPVVTLKTIKILSK